MKTRKYVYLLQGAATALLLLCDAVARPAEHTVVGRNAYVNDGCADCHGGAAQGGAGPQLVGTVIPLDVFTRMVRVPANDMPPYSRKVLSDRDLADIYTWIRSLTP